jgi:hypothetical protein
MKQEDKDLIAYVRGLTTGDFPPKNMIGLARVADRLEELADVPDVSPSTADANLINGLRREATMPMILPTPRADPPVCKILDFDEHYSGADRTRPPTTNEPEGARLGGPYGGAWSPPIGKSGEASIGSGNVASGAASGGGTLEPSQLLPLFTRLREEAEGTTDEEKEPSSPESEEAAAALADARRRPMTPEEQEAQCRSFAYGNTKIENDNVTRAMVDDAAREIAAEENGGTPPKPPVRGLSDEATLEEKVRHQLEAVFGKPYNGPGGPRPVGRSWCAVRERTADLISIGRCWFTLKDGVCPRHGDVRAVQEKYIKTGELTDELDLVGGQRI